MTYDFGTHEPHAVTETHLWLYNGAGPDGPSIATVPIDQLIDPAE